MRDNLYAIAKWHRKQAKKFSRKAKLYAPVEGLGGTTLYALIEQERHGRLATHYQNLAHLTALSSTGHPRLITGVELCK